MVQSLATHVHGKKLIQKDDLKKKLRGKRVQPALAAQARYHIEKFASKVVVQLLRDTFHGIILYS